MTSKKRLSASTIAFAFLISAIATAAHGTTFCSMLPFTPGFDHCVGKELDSSREIEDLIHRRLQRGEDILPCINQRFPHEHEPCRPAVTIEIQNGRP
jgi:hypothetical protein